MLNGGVSSKVTFFGVVCLVRQSEYRVSDRFGPVSVSGHSFAPTGWSGFFGASRRKGFARGRGICREGGYARDNDARHRRNYGRFAANRI